MKLKLITFFLVSLLIILNTHGGNGDEHLDLNDDDLDHDHDVDMNEPNAPVDEPQAEAPAPPKEKVKYVRPVPKGHHYFLETFELDTIGSRWIKSKAKKDDVDEKIAKYEGEWSIESSLDSVFEGDQGLVLKSKAKHHAISSKLLKVFQFTNGKPLVVQYEVKFQSPLECGGAYVKLIAEDQKLSLENFYDKTGFSIMFGPDKCGGESKYHFIIRYRHPSKGTYEEKHAKKSELLDKYFNDGKTHLYTLILEPDSTFKMLIDNNEVNSGSLLKDMTPPINPEKEIVDPNDKKPENWDDREKINDPDAVKPDDWDESEPKQIVDTSAQIPDGWLVNEPETLSDETAVKPDDWDDSTDGEWEAPKVDNPKCKNAPGCGKWTPPMVSNPKYKGKYKPPMINNPNYQGVWEPRKIENPDYFEDLNPFTSLLPFNALGLELWSMTENIYFDNFLITDDKVVADQFAKDSWVLKKSLENINSRSSDSVVDGLLNAANDKPWLWALYLLVVLLPIVIIAVFCCGKSSKTTPKVTDPAESKKTDAPVEDDDAKENDEAGDSENKNDVNEEEDNDMVEIDDEDVADADQEEKVVTKASLEPSEESDTKAKTTPVKRRAAARKD